MDNQILDIGKRLTIIIPVYNESGVIKNVIRDFHEKIIKRMLGVELIIAEDGSTDGTKEILKELNEEISFTLISGNERKGYTKAFKDALKTAKTELVLFSDSDAQHDPADFFKLLKEIEDNDVVGGNKSPRHDPFHRIVISKAYNFLIYVLFGLKMKDIDAGFKLIRKEVIDNVLAEVTSLKYCVMSEFIIKAYLRGYKIKEVPVSHYPRQSGGTAIFSPIKLPSIIIGIIKNLLEIKISYSGAKLR